MAIAPVFMMLKSMTLIFIAVFSDMYSTPSIARFNHTHCVNGTKSWGSMNISDAK